MTGLLYDNDERGRYAASLYTHETEALERPRAPRLYEHISAETIVIGAGFTGLSAALHLTEAGREVVIIDAHRAGWGASGRNGGQLGTGYNLSPAELVDEYGLQSARALWQFAESAKTTVHGLCDRYGINIDYVPGIVMAAHRKRHLAGLHALVVGAREHFDYPHGETLDAAALRAHVDSDFYHGGLIDHGAGHINPLKLALGLTNSALGSGAQLFEQTPALRIERLGRTPAESGQADKQQADKRWRVVTPAGSVTAAHVVFATNGYHENLVPELGRRVMPINSFVAATEPLGVLAETLLPTDAAVADTRFVVGYFRRSRDGRLVYGGGEGYRYRFPERFDERVRRSLQRVFPVLANIGFSHCWGGTLAITPKRMPFVRELRPRFLAAAGYSGHGVALSVGCGRALAEAILGDRDALELLSDIQVGQFPGRQWSRSWLLTTAMAAASAGDRF